MTIEVNLVDRRCGSEHGGLSCVYCYLPIEARVNTPMPKVDHEAIQNTLIRLVGKKDSFSLHGGEPLLASIIDLERTWSFGLEKFGRNGVQTSGRPITEEHIALFRKYKVNVGFSIDGPEELNDPRWAGSTEATRAATAHSCAMLERFLIEKTPPVGLIVTLHRKNASAERLPKLLEWFKRLDALGINGINVHALEHDGPIRYLALTEDETYNAFVAMAELDVKTKITPLTDMIQLLLAEDEWKWNDGTAAGVSCVWKACDPWNTVAVQGVKPDGTRTQCQRIHKDGVDWYATKPGARIRQLALRATPQEQGGCQGCRFMITCKGQCPGTAIDGDWRKRSRDCRTWFRLFEYFEQRMLKKGVTPITLDPRLPQIEEAMAAAWARGEVPSIKSLVAMPQGASLLPVTEQHGDHWDLAAFAHQAELVEEGGSS